MKTRPLERADLPKKRRSANSLKIPVLFKGKQRMVCDIHYADDALCYLEGAKGKPTKISDLNLITDNRSADDFKDDIKRVKMKIRVKRKEIEKLTAKIHELHKQYMEAL